MMFNKSYNYIIRRENKDYIYNFKCSNNVEYDVIFKYIKAGESEILINNIYFNSLYSFDYRKNISLKFFGTLVSIIKDFCDLIKPDVLIYTYHKNDNNKLYNIINKIAFIIMKDIKSKRGFSNITFEEIDSENKTNFYIKRNVKNTLLQLKRKRLNKR